VAPEILRDQGYRERADVFSAGSVFFNLLSGRYLFNGNNADEMLEANTSCENIKNIGGYLQGFSLECKELLFMMLSTNPLKRPSPFEALNHVWFKSDECTIKELLAVNLLASINPPSFNKPA
jgi:serine/threonine protein kinase